MTLAISARVERWPIAGAFVISRGSRTEAVVVVVEVTDGTHTGRGECVPYSRYGETVEGVVAQIEAFDTGKLDPETLRQIIPAGAARNALDCALWDLRAKTTGIPAWQFAGLSEPRPVATAYTLSLGSPADMAEAALRAQDRPLLKLKLGGEGDPDRVRAVREAAPAATLIVDANEAWNDWNFAENMRACAAADVRLVEQPLPAADDDFLRDAPRSVPICADESLHPGADLKGLVGKYDAVNIKLDKTGGLTEALDLLREARRQRFTIMIGCMIGTSLGMAPAMLLAQGAEFVDLDGPLLLAEDRRPGLLYRGSEIVPASAELWG